MPLLRACYSFLVVLALGLGTVMPAGHWDTTHETTVVAVENPMAVDCGDSDGKAAVPMPCGKVFCTGAAMISALYDPAPPPSAEQFAPAPDQVGTGLSRFPDTPPSRTILVG
jgi:hypothetical protein